MDLRFRDSHLRHRLLRFDEAFENSLLSLSRESFCASNLHFPQKDNETKNQFSKETRNMMMMHGSKSSVALLLILSMVAFGTWSNDEREKKVRWCLALRVAVGSIASQRVLVVVFPFLSRSFVVAMAIRLVESSRGWVEEVTSLVCCGWRPAT